VLRLVTSSHILASTAGGIQITEVEISHIFNEQLGIHGKVKIDSIFDQVYIFIESEEGSVIVTEPITLTSSGDVFYTHDLSQNPIRPFSNLNIWFEVRDKGGTSYASEKIPYYYDDNRFQWTSMETPAFTVFWYQDDPNLGEEILDTASDGLARIQNLFQVPQPEGIYIYAYANVVEMQDTLMFSGGSTSWVAGHANTGSGVIIVSLPPGPEQKFEIQRQIPHELTHILLFNKLGKGYQNLPRWLNEGLASSSELSPNPDFQLLLDKAYERDAIIPIRDLCTSFPLDAANFQLSYAESYDFTWYLQQDYTEDKIEQLLQVYSSGKDCEQGALEVFEQSLSEIEAAWRLTRFNEVQLEENLKESTPLMIIIGVVFVVPLSLLGVGISKINKRLRK